MRIGLLFILVLMLNPVNKLLADEHRVSLVTTHYPPYLNVNDPAGGVLTELIRAAFERSNMTIDVSWLAFDRALKLTQKTDHYDGIFSLWYTQERADWAYYSDPILPNVVGLFTHKDMQLPAYWNLKYLKLSAKTLGVVKGYSNPVELKSAALKTHVVNSDVNNLKALLTKKVDLIVIDKMVADTLIKQYFKGQSANFVWLEPPLEYKMQYLAIAKNAPFAKAKIAAFNQGLKQLKLDGGYQRIMKNHGFDWLLLSEQNNNE